MRSHLAPILAALLLVVSGCAAPVADPTQSQSTDWSWPDDPPTDRLGWENGYWHNESIDIDQSDGLNASEREAFVARTMARVELVRELEFKEPVPVEVVSREAYQAQSGTPTDPVHADWNDQVWESLLLVGEDRTIEEVFDDLYGGAVLGYYDPTEDRIVIVSDSPTPAIERGTLAHELVHALQDQHFGLDASPPTQDMQLADNGLVEGDARYVEYLYADRCGDEWKCVPRPERAASAGGSFDFSVFLVIYTPYSEGPTFVSDLRERGGWQAVNDAYANPPVSTEQLLSPGSYPDERPVEVTIEDRSDETWTRFDHEPVGDTVGEASIYAMLRANRAIDRSDLQRNTGAYSPYNYTSGPSSGWAGDLVVPYRPADDTVAAENPDQRAYVWRTTWDTEADAESFETTYTRIMLQLRMGASRVAPNTYVIDEGPFADAYRVTRDENTVTVVNAPTAEELDAVHSTSD
ncbi:Hvo_1808 family surface protein [Haloferax sp. DFSO60]|uniref:Hvo_1808 family surface protein n=1 Tax=Haloferax sp. DFSO60 TaxID=3388652 RepID=UPI00397BB6C9